MRYLFFCFVLVFALFFVTGCDERSALDVKEQEIKRREALLKAEEALLEKETSLAKRREAFEDEKKKNQKKGENQGRVSTSRRGLGGYGFSPGKAVVHVDKEGTSSSRGVHETNAEREIKRLLEVRRRAFEYELLQITILRREYLKRVSKNLETFLSKQDAFQKWVNERRREFEREQVDYENLLRVKASLDEALRQR